MRTSPGPGLGRSRSTISNGPLALPTCTALIFFAPAMMESSARFISKLIRLHQAALMRRKEHTVHEIRLLSLRSHRRRSRCLELGNFFGVAANYRCRWMDLGAKGNLHGPPLA